MEVNRIIQGDCLEVLKTFPDKSVDLVLTDPPYGINFGSEKSSMSAGMRVDGSRRKYNKWLNPIPKSYEKWDDIKPTKELFDEIFRVSKNQIVWGGNYFTDILPPTGGWLIWDKQVVMPTLSKCEMAWTSFLGHTEIMHYLWAGFRKEKPEERYHTTQKPLDVIGWCIKLAQENLEKPISDTLSNVINIILDPFLGSGTTAVAAKSLNRNYIGIEISEKYCKIAEQRLRACNPLL